MEESRFTEHYPSKELEKALEELCLEQNAQERLLQLKRASLLFSEETDKLKVSYQKLQQEFQKVNGELELTHQKLLAKAQELNTLSQYLGSVLKHISQGLIFITNQGLILSFNDAAQKLLQKEDLLQKRYAHHFRDDFFGFSMQDALYYGLSHPLSYITLTLSDGSKREIEITTSFIYEGQAPYQGIILLLRDITEMQRLQLINARGDRMKELGQMVATVTHEIKNPLGGIQGYAMLLSRELENPSLKEMAGHIIEGTKTLDRLLSKVLQYSRPVQIQSASLDIASFLRKVCKFIKMDPSFPANVQLLMHIAHDPLVAPIDPEALRSALLNLIVNAFQAMPEGGVITVSLFKHDTTYAIGISDNGIGIDERDLPHLFSPFFTTKSKGNGLGLAETFKIVQAHMGTIDVRSKRHQGTTFTINLPLKR
jgi:PAS domain S-box-containing protein